MIHIFAEDSMKTSIYREAIVATIFHNETARFLQVPSCFNSSHLQFCEDILVYRMNFATIWYGLIGSPIKKKNWQNKLQKHSNGTTSQIGTSCFIRAVNKIKVKESIFWNFWSRFMELKWWNFVWIYIYLFIFNVTIVYF